MNLPGKPLNEVCFVFFSHSLPAILVITSWGSMGGGKCVIMRVVVMDGGEGGEGSPTDFREQVIRLLPGAWITEIWQITPFSTILDM